MPDHSKKPADVLHYAPSDAGRRQRLRRIVKVTLWSTLTLVVLAAMFHGFDAPAHFRSCSNCVATEFVRGLTWYGIVLSRNTKPIQTSVSTLIQEHQGHLCAHQWEFAFGDGGTMFSGNRRAGRGRDRMKSVRFYEQLPHLREVLIAWELEESGVFDRFQALIRHGSKGRPDLEQFELDLWERLEG